MPFFFSLFHCLLYKYLHPRYVLSENGGGGFTNSEYGSSATATRTRVLASLSQQLMAAAQEHRVAVVLTNQVHMEEKPKKIS
jgi:hypothetical protein